MLSFAHVSQKEQPEDLSLPLTIQRPQIVANSIVVLIWHLYCSRPQRAYSSVCRAGISGCTLQLQAAPTTLAEFPFHFVKDCCGFKSTPANRSSRSISLLDTGSGASVINLTRRSVSD